MIYLPVGYCAKGCCGGSCREFDCQKQFTNIDKIAKTLISYMITLHQRRSHSTINFMAKEIM